MKLLSINIFIDGHSIKIRSTLTQTCDLDESKKYNCSFIIHSTCNACCAYLLFIIFYFSFFSVSSSGTVRKCSCKLAIISPVIFLGALLAELSVACGISGGRELHRGCIGFRHCAEDHLDTHVQRSVIPGYRSHVNFAISHPNRVFAVHKGVCTRRWKTCN